MALTLEIGRDGVTFEGGLMDLLVDEESSLTSEATSAGGGVTSTGGEYGWMLRVIGSRCFFSLILMTIFSRSSGVICRSMPRLRLLTESCR